MVRRYLWGSEFRMKCSLFNSSYTQEVVQLFTTVFSESENESEGKIIGNLVSDLISTTKAEDLVGFVATSDERVVAAIFFSRIIVPSEEVAFILSPVAVATSEQCTGVGQQLINHGLHHLKSSGVDLAFTYGDPRYYSKVGFSQIDETIVKAPFELSQPEGWLAQSLGDNPVEAMRGSTRCVDALSDQKYW